MVTVFFQKGEVTAARAHFWKSGCREKAVVGLYERTGTNMEGEHLTVSDKTLTKTAISVFDVVETDTRWVETDILHLRSGKKGKGAAG